MRRLLVAAVGIGAAAGVALVSRWSLPIADALAGPQPQGWWLLSRASGLLAYGALALSMAVGLAITNRWARLWPGGPMAFEIHQHASLLALALTAVHALALLGDRWVRFDLASLLLPFAAPTERWAAIALGQLALYGLVAVAVSFRVRRAIGARLWRAIHFASFGLFALATIHGLASGSDGAAIYWPATAIVGFLTIHRLLPRPRRAR